MGARRRKFATTVYLDPDQHEDLHVLAAVTGVPMAEWVRRAVQEVIDDPDKVAAVSQARRAIRYAQWRRGVLDAELAAIDRQLAQAAGVTEAGVISKPEGS